MKKLILKDHLNQKLVDFDLYVEGQDFSHTFLEPKAFWLGTIMVVDQEPELELGPEPLPEIASELTEEQKAEIDETHAYEEAKAAHESQIEAKEALNEPEEIHNQGNGDLRPDTTIELESVTELPEKPVRGKSAKGSKNTRKRKAA